MISKHDISEYYSDPAVRRNILDQIKNRPVVAVQSTSNEDVIRRNNPSGEPIRILEAKGDATNRNDLAWYTDRRFSEFHPAIGKRTKQVWVDIDPGPKRTLNSLKPIVADVENMLRRLPEVKRTHITYSGGRGFHVKGQLQRKADTDTIRKKLEQELQSLKIPDAVFRKPKGDEVRLDTSTLKNKGSIRADYSLNSSTGRVAVPLTQRELKGFTPEQAEVVRILKDKEFAPGIPRSKRIYSLPEKTKDKHWTLAIQEHDAAKAGKHWDLRLVDPDTGFAHSWAVPKATFPEGNQKLLALRTPTHTSHYALNFGSQTSEKIHTGYGKGTVQIVHKEPIKILHSDNDKVKFQRILGDTPKQFTLFRIKGDSWLFKESPSVEKVGMNVNEITKQGYLQTLTKLGLNSSPSMEDQKEQAPSPMRPVDQLVQAIASMEQPNYGSRRGANSGNSNNVEDRLNRPTTFASPQDVPHHFMDGPTTPLYGAGF